MTVTKLRWLSWFSAKSSCNVSYYRYYKIYLTHLKQMPQNVHSKLKAATPAVAFSKLQLCLTCAGLTFRWNLVLPVSEVPAADPI